MPGKNKTPLLGWHPPAELSAWVRAEAAHLGIPISEVLNAAVECLMAQRPGHASHDASQHHALSSPNAPHAQENGR